MHLSTFIFAIILSLVTLSTAGPILPHEPESIRLRLYNNCHFDVWVRQAVAAGTDARPGDTCRNGPSETPNVKIGYREVFVTPIPAYKDTCSHSIKVGRSPGTHDIYQYEFNWVRENNKIWYNLSEVNGNPFTDVARQIGGPMGSDCPYLRCQPGEDGHQCDYPVMGDCLTVGDLIAYLCRAGVAMAGKA